MDEDHITFKDLGLAEELCEACDKMGWKIPTQIQIEVLPVALKGKDIIGLAETGSGKTAAFGLPILQALLLAPERYFAIILTPTRELAVQIKDQLDMLGKEIGLLCCAVVGGIDVAQQAMMIMRRPHIIVATLGRLVYQIKNLKGFSKSLLNVKYLVMDEADMILNLDFADEVDCIIRTIPTKRTTMLFSATITNKVRELQRAHLKDAVKIDVNTAFKIVDSLQQYMLPTVFIEKHMYLIYLIRQLGQKSVIVFCNTRAYTLKTALVLRQCGHKAIPLYGQMTQCKRLDALAKFRAQSRSILVATDVASRGLDIPCVDYVILLDVPRKSEDYIHRVGRTARAGRPGVSITVVSQFEIEDFHRIEHLIFKDSTVKCMPEYPTKEEDAKKLADYVTTAEKAAKMELKRIEELQQRNKNRGRDSDDEDDTEEATGVRRRLKGPTPQRGPQRGVKRSGHKTNGGGNRGKRRK